MDRVGTIVASGPFGFNNSETKHGRTFKFVECDNIVDIIVLLKNYVSVISISEVIKV